MKAFQLADAMVTDIYRATTSFPTSEQFGLTSQLRRAAVAVAANIVEGCGREGLKEYLNFLNIAFGSLREVGYYIELAGRLDYLAEPDMKSLLLQYDECAKVLQGLMASLRRPS